MTAGAAAPPPTALARAKARLDLLQLYPRPVRIGRVRIFVTPWLFRLPWFRRFDGYALHTAILLRARDASDDLITHELCHVWQMQHKPLAMPLSYVLSGYAANPFERQARAAVAATRAPGGRASRGSAQQDPPRPGSRSRPWAGTAPGDVRSRA